MQRECHSVNCYTVSCYSLLILCETFGQRAPGISLYTSFDTQCPVLQNPFIKLINRKHSQTFTT